MWLIMNQALSTFQSFCFIYLHLHCVKEGSLLLYDTRKNFLLVFQWNACSEIVTWGPGKGKWNVCLNDDCMNNHLKCQQSLWYQFKLKKKTAIHKDKFPERKLPTFYRKTFYTDMHVQWQYPDSFVIVWHCVGLTLIAMLSCILHAHTEGGLSRSNWFACQSVSL